MSSTRALRAHTRESRVKVYSLRPPRSRHRRSSAAGLVFFCEGVTPSRSLTSLAAKAAAGPVPTVARPVGQLADVRAVKDGNAVPKILADFFPYPLTAK